jgi:hypothetical protein
MSPLAPRNFSRPGEHCLVTLLDGTPLTGCLSGEVFEVAARGGAALALIF